MQRIPVTTAALITLVLVFATACSATETVTVLDSARVTAAETSGAEPTAPPSAVAPAPIDAASDNSADTSSDEASDDNASDDDASNDDATAPPARAATNESATGACTYLGVDFADDMQVELQLTSTLDEQADAIVSYAVLAGDGSELAESTLFIEDLLPGESIRMNVDTVTDAPADDSGVTCAIDGLVSADSPGDDEPFRATSQDTCAFVEVDFADDAQLTMTVTNPEGEPSELSVDYALRSADGVRFIDGVTFFDETRPGESITLDVDTFDELPDWVDPDEISCEILAIVGY